MTNDEVNRMIGTRLRELRIARRLSMEEVGRLGGGITYQQIQKYESGANRMSASRLWRIATALEVSICYFFKIEQPDASDAEAMVTSQALERIDPPVRQHLVGLIDVLSR